MAARIAKSDGVALHPREDMAGAGVLQAANSELVLDLNGDHTLAIDLRANGITGTPIVVLEGTVDGANYEQVPFYSKLTQLWTMNWSPTTVGGIMYADVAAYRRVRLRTATAPTAGTYTAVIRSTVADLVTVAMTQPATCLGTATAAAGAALTLTLAAPGVGLFHYITRLAITRFAAAALTAAAAPIVVTTTNIGGALAFSVPAEAAAQGVVWEKEIDFTQPIKSSVANTATTIVCPLTAGVLWRVTAYGYVGA